MKRKSKVFVTLLFTLVMVCIIGCRSPLFVSAVNQNSNENIVAEFYPNVEENNQEVSVNHKQWWEGEWKEESIINSAGKEIELKYLSSIEWPESEEETLAKFLCCEGGTYEEKTRIAQIVSWKKYDSECADTIEEILKTKSYFVINPDYWNQFANPTEDDFEIAKAALNSTEKPEYVHYIFREFYEDMFEGQGLYKDVYKTANYVFCN